MSRHVIKATLASVILFGLACTLHAGGGPVEKWNLVKPGMEAAEVLELMGQPQSTMTMGSKSVLKWPEVKVTVVDESVTTVQVLDPQQSRSKREERAQTAARLQEETKERRKRVEAERLEQQAIREELEKQAAVKADINKLEQAAENGDARAQHELGMAYQSGENVPMDKYLAFWWFTKAAEQSHPASQYQLGLMYLNGEGTRQNFTASRKWLIDAADQEHVMAQFTLGTLYAEGHGVDAFQQRFATAW